MFITLAILTILVEISVLLILKERSAKIIGASVIINLITNLILNITLANLARTEFIQLIAMFIGELIVFIVEALIYFIFIKKFKRCLFISLICNLVSFSFGLVVLFSFVLLNPDWSIII